MATSRSCGGQSSYAWICNGNRFFFKIAQLVLTIFNPTRIKADSFTVPSHHWAELR